jgi:hypothetical protein
MVKKRILGKDIKPGDLVTTGSSISMVLEINKTRNAWNETYYSCTIAYIFDLDLTVMLPLDDVQLVSCLK